MHNLPTYAQFTSVWEKKPQQITYPFNDFFLNCRLTGSSNLQVGNHTCHCDLLFKS